MAEHKMKSYRIESAWLDRDGVLHPAGSVIHVSSDEKPARGWKLQGGEEKPTVAPPPPAGGKKS